MLMPEKEGGAVHAFGTDGRIRGTLVLLPVSDMPEKVVARQFIVNTSVVEHITDEAIREMIIQIIDAVRRQDVIVEANLAELIAHVAYKNGPAGPVDASGVILGHTTGF